MSDERLSEIRQFLTDAEDWDGYEWGPEAKGHIRFLLEQLDETTAQRNMLSDRLVALVEQQRQ